MGVPPQLSSQATPIEFIGDFSLFDTVYKL